MGSLVRDLRHAFRGLLRTPGFTAVAVLTLAIGIAATTTVFSWVQSLFLAPLPGVSSQGSVRLISGLSRDGGQRSFSIPNLRDLQKAGLPFDLASYALRTVNLTEGERPERLWVSVVSGNFFDVLGVRAALGRTFTAEEDGAPNAHPVAVLSHRLWQRRFQGDPGIAGRTIRLNGQAYTVVGIAPEDFHGADIGLSVDLWIPLAMEERILGESRRDERGWSWMHALARLHPGVSDEQAATALGNAAQRLAETYPENNEGVTYLLYRFWTAPGSREALLAMTVAGAMALLVLALACANVANLLLVRALGRRRESAIRLALGAGRASLIRRLLTEGIALSLLAGTAGIALALAAQRLIGGLTPSADLPPSPPPTVDARILAFAAVLSLVTGVLFSLAPALQMASPHLSSVLRDEAGAVSGGRKGRLRGALVVLQVALSCVLLISAGLFGRSLQRAARLDPGFSARDMLLASLDVFPAGYDAARGRTFYRELQRRVSALPGVESVSLAMMVPLSGNSNSTTIEVVGYAPKPDEEVTIGYNAVGPGYFETMGIPVLRGRAITAQDDERASEVVVINEAMAQRYWPGRDPLGGTIERGDRKLTVIGVVRNGAYLRLREETQPYMYFALSQNYLSGQILHVRTTGDPGGLAAAVRQEVRAMDPDLPLESVQTLEQHLRRATFQPRLLATFLGGLGTIALLLSTVGLYSVIRYTVSQRTRELGVRLALGAQPGEVARLVLGQGMVLALLGAGLGLAVALATSRLLESQLYGVSATDPLIFTGVVALLTVVSALASWLPARRAAAVDPMIALRAE